MKKTSMGLLGLALLLFSVTSFSQDQQAMMEAWQAYMTPGEMHKVLAETDGDFDADVSIWMDPNAQPMKSKGTCTNKMILGGRYQQSVFKADFMGQPMEGHGISAFDNARKQFVSTWVDNMGTGITKLTGTYDSASKTITYTGEQTDPMTAKEMKIRQTLKMVDPSKHVLEMFMTHGGAPEYKSMEVVFTRKK